MQLTIQILLDDRWHDAATLHIPYPERGRSGPAQLDYAMDYAVKWHERNDVHACSMLLPVQIMIEHTSRQWFTFLDDIMPAGAAARFWIRHLGLGTLSEGEQQYRLLAQGAISPIGNMRIKEAVPPLPLDNDIALRRFTVQDVVDRQADFLEYAQQMGAISGGATGAGGEAPKLLLRCSSQDEIWIDTFQEDTRIPDTHYLVKFPRGKRTERDCDILRAEYHFYHELSHLGIETIDITDMRLLEGNDYPSLWLPRFDVEWQDTRWQRFGMESVYSLMGKLPGSNLVHGDVIHTLARLFQNTPNFDTSAFVIEWVKRDLLNIAFGNSDNHGRNTAFLKKPDHIWFSPVYDFAPMKADVEGIIRTTVWGSPLEVGGEYKWTQIADTLSDLCPPDLLINALQETAKKLVGLQGRLRDRGTPKNILDMPAIGLNYLDDKLSRWGLL
jgi:serine/threonine-protein kinase HipA